MFWALPGVSDIQQQASASNAFAPSTDENSPLTQGEKLHNTQTMLTLALKDQPDQLQRLMEELYAAQPGTIPDDVRAVLTQQRNFLSQLAIVGKSPTQNNHALSSDYSLTHLQTALEALTPEQQSVLVQKNSQSLLPLQAALSAGFFAFMLTIRAKRE